MSVHDRYFKPLRFSLLLHCQALLLVFFCATVFAAAQINTSDNPKPSQGAPQVIAPQMQKVALAGRDFMRVDEYYDATTHV
ncbi:MAG TPA: hypothetical protein VE779_16465, partial [Candidatus Angelobacter sp.]|nr:hypothetical protein [Candidatus Angelobacter sp.]